MSQKKPFFITGASAKIKLNGKTVAFATDVSYRITVAHASPRVLGRFEVEVHQPLSYDVRGSLSIIRYAKDVTSAISAPSSSVSPQGNSIGSFGAAADGFISSAIGLPNASGQWDGRADEAFIPSRMSQSKMFAIEILQQVDGKNISIAILRDCRMTESEFRLSKKSSANQNFSFVARYADEDGFSANKSGVGQELS